MRTAIIATLAAGSFIAAIGLAEQLATSHPAQINGPVGLIAPDHIVGSNVASTYWYNQTTSDCMEAAFNSGIYAPIRGSRMREATVIAEAQKLHVMGANPAGGSSWSGLPKLAAHYGIKITLGTHTIETIEADLAAGDHVIAFVDAETIWNNSLDFRAVYPPQANSNLADHAVVVDSINVTRGTVTLTDSGPSTGATETVDLAAFGRAVATSGYNYAVASATGK